MSDIFREVEEELRRDRLERVWKRYGSWIIAAMLLIVVGTASYVAWQNWRQSRQAEQTAALSEALRLVQPGDSTAVADALAELATNASGGIDALARFYEAGLLAQDGNVEAAVGVYDAIAAAGDVPLIYRDFATLLSVMHQVDEGDPSQLQGRLAGLVGDTNPWRYTARELNALLMARAGDTAAAREQFQKLADDPTAPSGLRSRARQFVDLYAERS